MESLFQLHSNGSALIPQVANRFLSEIRDALTTLNHLGSKCGQAPVRGRTEDHPPSQEASGNTERGQS